VKKCTPLCPYFRCQRRATEYRRNPRTGRTIVWCTFADDICQGYRCMFAQCAVHALNPSTGECTITLRSRKRKKDITIEEEAEILDKEYLRIRDKLKRLGGRIDEIE